MSYLHDVSWEIFRRDPYGTYKRVGKEVLYVLYKGSILLEVKAVDILNLGREASKIRHRCELCDGYGDVVEVVAKNYGTGFLCDNCRKEYNVVSLVMKGRKPGTKNAKTAAKPKDNKKDPMALDMSKVGKTKSKPKNVAKAKC